MFIEQNHWTLTYSGRLLISKTVFLYQGSFTGDEGLQLLQEQMRAEKTAREEAQKKYE